MSPSEFVDAIRKVVMDAAVTDTIAVIEKPPGRRPAPTLSEMSRWYHALRDEDRAMLRSALELVARQSVFGFLAVLDGARRATSDGGSFELTYRGPRSVDRLSGTEDGSLHELL